MTKMGSSFLEVIFPPKCLVCEKNRGYLCASCREKLETPPFQKCPVCELSSWRGITHKSCRSPLVLDGLTTLFLYNPPLGRLIKRFKLELIKEAEDVLVDLAVDQLRKNPIIKFWRKNNFSLVPIPLHPAKRLWRGFSQTQVLAQKINFLLQLEFQPNLLVRKKLTPPQSGLSLKDRKKNIKGAFELNFLFEKKIKGKNILIFDDIVTTTATLKEAGSVLKKKGGGLVWGLAIAG